MIVVMPRSILKGPNIGRGAGVPGRDGIPPGEARRRAEIPIGNLMAQRTGDAVVRKPIGAIAFVCDGQVIEHLRLRAPLSRASVRDIGIWQVAHSS